LAIIASAIPIAFLSAGVAVVAAVIVAVVAAVMVAVVAAVVVAAVAISSLRTAISPALDAFFTLSPALAAILSFATCFNRSTLGHFFRNRIQRNRHLGL
jgi:hypothetical protein